MNNKSGSERVGCHSHSCYINPPSGQGTNGPCMCSLLDYRKALHHLQKLCEEQKGEIERLKFGAEVRAELRAISDPYTEFQEGRMSKQAFISAISGPFESQLAEQKAENERLKKAEKCLDDQLAIQLAEPSIKTDAYMAGLANGMLLAKANFGGDYNPISYKDSRLAEQTERVKAQDVEIANLRKFAEHILEGYSWGHDVDGGDAQEKAVELGLVELRPIDPEDSIDGETEHYFTKWTPKQALNQERLGDGK